MPRYLSSLTLGLTVGVSTVFGLSHPELERVVPVPADQPIPLIDFCRPDLFGVPSINWSGSHIVAVVNTDDEFRALIIYDLEKKKFDKIGGSRKSDVSSFFWLNDTRMLLKTDGKQSVESSMLVVDIEKDGVDTNAIGYSTNFDFISAPDGDEKHPLAKVTGGYMASSVLSQTAMVLDTDKHLIGKFDPNDVAMSKSFPFGVAASVKDSFPKAPGDTIERYLADPYGKLAYAETASKGVSRLYRWTGAAWELCPLDLDKIKVIEADVGADRLIVSEISYEGKRRSLRFCNSRTGELGEVILEDSKYDLNEASVWRDRETKRLLGVTFNRGAPAAVWLDSGYKDVQAAVDKMFAGKLVRIISHDLKHQKFVVHVGSDRDPGRYELVDLSSGKVTPIKSKAPWFDEKRSSPTQMMGYKTRDGHRIEAYLTLPAGTSKQNPAPLVVLPHSSLFGRDVWGFNAKVQMLAMQGYAVFQPNFRGSAGYQSEFPEKDVYDFKKMSEDVTDGVKALIKSGLVDAKRIGILGEEFGGYLALDGAASEKELYRCAVSISGITDWGEMIREMGRNAYDLGSKSNWYKRKVGDPDQEKERFASYIPASRMEGSKASVFLAYGSDHLDVPIALTKEAASQLSRFNIPTETYYFPLEGKAEQTLDDKLEMYKRILAFLEKNLKNAK